ncbi:MAG: hypothetical protein Q8877_02445 [Sweet potato little leaf phytoplasma]|nr:hypothetical protein [Sweet potato little leaf phytoplasma]
MANQAQHSLLNDNPFTEFNDTVAAAQKLMQLNKDIDEEEVLNQMQSNMKINEENVEMIDRPKKMKKDRSLVDIYKVTTPINVGKGKKKLR